MLSVTNKPFMLSGVIPNVILLNVIFPNVVAPTSYFDDVCLTGEAATTTVNVISFIIFNGIMFHKTFSL
jgi:hypothetical protein